MMTGSEWWRPMPQGASTDAIRILGARGVRAFGDGFVALLLPIYLFDLGFDGGEQDPENDQHRAQEARGEHQGKDLRLVANLGETNDDGRHEESFHEVPLGSGGK